MGPEWHDGTIGKREELSLGYMNAIRKANEHNFRSIAMAGISMGSFGFPTDLCAKILMNCVYNYANTREHLMENSQKVLSAVDQICITDRDEGTVKIFEKELDKRVRKRDRKSVV